MAVNEKNENKRKHSNSGTFGALYFVLVIMIAVAIFLSSMLFKISVIDHNKYEELLNRSHYTSIDIPAGRGSIYDSNSTPLAWSATVYNVFIDPGECRTEFAAIDKKNKKLIKQDGGKTANTEDIKGYRDITKLRVDFVNFLAEKLDMNTTEIDNTLNMDSRYYVLKKDVEKQTADEIKTYMSDNEFNFIGMEESTKRYYTQDDLAASVIGFTNGDDEGQYGIEYSYDKYLSGTDGKIITAVDANNNEMPYDDAQSYDAIDGDSVYLTIDTTVQYYLEKNLAKMCEDFNIRDRACGIIMNAKTGAIYAMATSPSFDLNNPSEIYDTKTKEELEKLTGKEYDTQYAADREEQWKNKNVAEIYIPGSVFKVYTGSAAIEEDVIDPDTFSYTCTGSMHVADAILYCSHRAGHGTETFQQAMTNSCNPAFMRIGLDMGEELFCRYFSTFGLDSLTGIDLPSEASPIYYSLDEMGSVELASSSFGQSTKITPIQMITGYASVINGGNLLTPYVVGEVKDSSGNTVLKNTTNVKRKTISEETSAKMRKVLETVVEDAPSSNAYIAGYKIGGKSGTAQKNDEYDINNEAGMQYCSSYCCFAPADDPEVIMLIIADEPDKSVGYYAAKVVAPTAKSTFEEVLPYLGIYPEYSDSDYSSLVTQVEDVTGQTVNDASDVISNLGLSVKVVGDGNAVSSQSPEGGATMLQDGTVYLYTGDTESEKVSVPDLVGTSMTAAKSTLYGLGLNMYISDANGTDELVITGQSITEGTEVDQGTVVTVTLGEPNSNENDGENDIYNGENYVED